MTKEYEIHQDDMMVAGASGENALADALHYCFIYGQDGPVELFEVTRVKVDLDGNASLAAPGGNAALEVTNGTLPELPEYGDMGSLIKKNKIYPKYSAEQMTAYGKACAAASAPNAALVAALDGMLGAWNMVCDANGWERDHIQQQKDAVAALSAAGQEVK